MAAIRMRWTSKLDRDASAPHWAGDSKGIFCTYTDQGDTKLTYLPLDGSPKVLAGHLNAGGDYSVAKNGSFAVRYDDALDPGDVGVGSLANSKVNVLTSLNRELFTAKKLGAVEELWYESSFDQRKIEGWIIGTVRMRKLRERPVSALAKNVNVNAETRTGCLRERHGLALWGGDRYPIK
jgi:hypothetical protein